MNNLVKGLLVFVIVLLLLIGYLCYQVSESAFNNFLIFLVPMALCRLSLCIFKIKL